MAATLSLSSPLSSPFRESHRRTRSHSSLSTPSSSPVSRQHHEQWRVPTRRGPIASSRSLKTGDASLIRPDIADQPPTKWDVDMWRRGKRPRRELPQPVDVDADMESCDDEPSPLHASGLPSTSEVSTTSATTIDAPLSQNMSASPARLPCSSSAFNFFPTQRRSEPHESSATSSPNPVPASHVNPPDLSQLRGEAFSELRKSVAEANEGFVKRMQAFEESRSRTESSNVLQTDLASSFSSTSEREEDTSDSLHDGNTLQAFNKRGRKRPSPCSPPTSSRRLTATVKHITQGNARTVNDDDDSDVEIFSSLSAPDDLSRWSPMKKRAVSLGGLELSYATAQPSSLEDTLLSLDEVEASNCMKIIPSQRDRSSSPPDMLDYQCSPTSLSSSDDEGEDGDGIRLNLDNTRKYRSRRFRHRRQHHSPSQSRFSSSGRSVQSSAAPSLSFSFSSNSRNSSITSLSLGASLAATSADERTPWNSTFTSSSPPPNASKAERAVAALTLAMANGAGSVSDYESLRAAQGVIADSQGEEAGDLWD
ncbi:hypothetical protein SCHPADRAFT_12128 [Schizopora paradoxa]|uniref:Uncharacterized protein n=1 Tax=Schizopora paradoxa TaxID=27342 RepID=A0A0H2S8K4_9AGAM|nr:hypothetical protein SCHPADRAFT_12128 [Schizopora paradoxa]